MWALDQPASDLTNEAVWRLILAHDAELALWESRPRLPERKGEPAADWLRIQRQATYDIVRDGEVVAQGIPNSLDITEFHRLRRIAAMRAALAALTAPDAD